MSDISEWLSAAMPLLIEYGISIVGAIVILILGWGAANWFAGRVRKACDRSEKMDTTLTPILVQITRIFVIIITLLAVLNQFGVQTTSIIAILGAAGLAIGLALQGTLTNVASGTMLMLLRPIKIGDVAELNGQSGVIDEIGLFATKMHTFDNVGVVMPNSQVWSSAIKNYTAFETRRADMVFGIGYDDDMDKAIKIINEILDADERVLDEPESMVFIGDLADSSVNIYVRPWTRIENLWPLRFDLPKRIKERFDEEGISIPYPQRDVHLFQEKDE